MLCNIYTAYLLSIYLGIEDKVHVINSKNIIKLLQLNYLDAAPLGSEVIINTKVRLVLCR